MDDCYLLGDMLNRLLYSISWLIVSATVILGIAFLNASHRPERSISPTVISTIAPVLIPEQTTFELPSLPLSAEKEAIGRLAQLSTYRPERPRFKIFHYKVQKGDSALSIAKKFNIQPETILWGNEGLSVNASALKIGTELNILPVDGTLHTVREGDTLERLQQQHGISVEEIVNFIGNDFKGVIPKELTPGDQIIVPGGKRPIVWQEPGPVIIPGKGRESPGYYAGQLVNKGTGYFSWPVSPIVITQTYWSGHPAIDIDTYPRQPIFASDSGTVIFSGWDQFGFGNLVIIDHGNGYWTYYGHNTANLVRVGQGVVRGQQIAESGSTGNSTGDHIDFRIRLSGGGFLNPANFLP